MIISVEPTTTLSAHRRGLRMPGLTIGGAGRADVVLLAPAPEAHTARGIGDLERRLRVRQRARLLRRAAC